MKFLKNSTINRFSNLEIDYLKIVPSYYCSINCKYCYNRLLKQNSKDNPKALLNSLDEFINNQKTSFIAEIIGGEPLEENTLNTSKSLLNRLSRSHLCKKRILSTAVKDIRLLDSLIDYLDFVYLSMDIFNSTNNKKKLSLTKLLQLTNFINCNNVELSIAVMLDGCEDEEDIKNFIFSLIHIGVKNICFGYVKFQHLNTTTLLNYYRLFYFLFFLKYSLTDKIFIGGNILETLDLAVQNITRKRICHCGETSVVLQPDGNVTPSLCQNYYSDNSYSLTEFSKSKMYRWNFLESNRCFNCSLWPFCRGGCMGASIHLYKNYLSPDIEFCSIISKVWEKIEIDMGIIKDYIRM